MSRLQARFRAADLREAGYPACEPIAVGYSFAELKAGGYPPAELLRAAGYSAEELVALRYTLRELRYGGYALAEVKDFFPDHALAAAGFANFPLLPPPARVQASVSLETKGLGIFGSSVHVRLGLAVL